MWASALTNPTVDNPTTHVYTIVNHNTVTITANNVNQDAHYTIQLVIIVTCANGNVIMESMNMIEFVIVHVKLLVCLLIIWQGSVCQVVLMIHGLMPILPTIHVSLNVMVDFLHSNLIVLVFHLVHLDILCNIMVHYVWMYVWRVIMLIWILLHVLLTVWQITILL